jgi:hypothetical protein
MKTLMMIKNQGKTLIIWSECLGTFSKSSKAVGVAILPAIRQPT